MAQQHATESDHEDQGAKDAEELLLRRDMERDAEYRELKGRQMREKREQEAEERRLHDSEDFELMEAKGKLQRVEQRDRIEREANERARDSKTQAELKAAQDELDKSKYNSCPTFITYRYAALDSVDIGNFLQRRGYPGLIFTRSAVRVAERDIIVKEHALAQLKKKQAAEDAAQARRKTDVEAIKRWHASQPEEVTKNKNKKIKQGSRSESDALTGNSVENEDMRILIDGSATLTIGDVSMLVQDSAETRIPTSKGTSRICRDSNDSDAT